MSSQFILRGLLVACLGFAPVPAAADENFPGAFHITGVPDVKRDQRVNLHLVDDALLVERVGVSYSVPYARIKQVLLLHADRNYEKISGAAAAASQLVLGIPLGALVMLKKHKVDTVIIDYENERHGRLGIVLQVERGQGEEVGNILKKHGVTLVEPPGDSPTTDPSKKTDPSKTPPEPGRPQ